MDFIQVVRSRRSVRSYDSGKKVSIEKINELIEVSGLAPSSYNLQPYKFIVVQSDEGKQKIYSCTQNQKHILECSAALIVLAKLNPSEDVEQVLEDREKKGYFTSPEFKEKYKQKMLALDSSEKIYAWATKNAYLASMVFMLSATNAGLATCPVEGFDHEKLAKEFGLPKNYPPVLVITFGYEKDKPKEQLARKPLSDIVSLEKLEK